MPVVTGAISVLGKHLITGIPFSWRVCLIDRFSLQVLQLGALIRSKQVTSLELVKLYIERLKRYRLYFLHLSTHLKFTSANIWRGECKKGKLQLWVDYIPHLLYSNYISTMHNALNVLLRM